MTQSDWFDIRNGVLYRMNSTCPSGSVTIPEGVTKIASYAFRFSNLITELHLPDTLTTIEGHALESCFHLRKIFLPDSVSSIGEYAFASCDELTEVRLPERLQEIPDGLFAECSSLRHISIPSGVRSIGSRAFFGCTALPPLSIPESVQEFGPYAFGSCPAQAGENGLVIFNGVLCACNGSPVELVIPEGVTRITRSLFFPIRKILRRVILPSTLTHIEDYAFSNCTALTEISLPDSLVFIGEQAFSGCTGLRSLRFPVQCPELGSRVFFGCSALADAQGFIATRHVLWDYRGSDPDPVIPDSITVLSDQAFSRKSFLQSVTIHDRVTTIGESCFQNCSSLELVRLPASLSEISNNLFRDCPCLKSVSIPENVTRIGENAFLRCGTLKKINLPFGVTEIGINAFAECAGLKEIHIPDSVTELGEGALSDCIQLRRVTLPRSLTAISSRLFHNDRLLSRISLPHTVRQIGTEAFAACESLQTLSLPSNLEFIGDVAFLGCSSLKCLTIPDAVTRIPQNLFLNCTSLSEVCLPSGLQEIGQSAFDGCAALTRLNLPPHQITIGSGAFRGCSGLADDNGFVVIQGTLFDCYSPDRRIVIPQGVRRLSQNSLRRIRKPEYLIVPDTVLEAESLVFSEMDSISWAEVSSRSILEDLLEDLSSYTVHRLCHHYLSTDLESDLWRDACYDRRKELMQLYIQGDAAGPAHKLLLCGSVSLSEIQEYLFLSEENLEMTALFLDFQERCFSPEEREAYRIAQSETDLGLRERTLEEWSSILEMDISGGAICINGFKTDTPVLHIPDRIGHLNVLSIHQPRDPWLKCRSCVITLDPEILSVDIGAFSGVPQLTDIYILGADTQLDIRVLGDPPQVTIHAPLNSRAHMFAERFNIPFESIDKEN